MMQILNNTNFRGLLISNLVIGNSVLLLFARNAPSIFFCMSFSALLVFYILFKKVDFVLTTKRKLLFYSFLSTMAVVFIGLFTSVIVMTFAELSISSLFTTFVAVIILGGLSFGLIIIPIIYCVPFFVIINFLWLLKERKESEKKNKEVEKMSGMITKREKKPLKISIRTLLFINTFVIIFSMIWVCNHTPEGWEGGILSKEYGNIIFLLLMLLNLLYSIYYAIKINRTPKRILFLLLNVIAIFVIYTICAVILSISKIGL